MFSIFKPKTVVVQPVEDELPDAPFTPVINYAANKKANGGRLGNNTGKIDDVLLMLSIVRNLS